jgi:hypothetical protein
MTGAQVLSSGAPGQLSTAWSIVGQRDFDGDGKADLLWLDTNGNVGMWLMNGTQFTAPALWLGQVPTDWRVIATADFDGDGKGDILWQDIGYWSQTADPGAEFGSVISPQKSGLSARGTSVSLPA